MALEKDQERPTSPGGSRKIKRQNINYILDGPLGATQSNQNSAFKNKDFLRTGTGFNSSGTMQNVLNQINNNIQSDAFNNKGMIHAFQDSPGGYGDKPQFQ